MAATDASARRRKAREAYRPKRTTCLLVAEAPPNDERYFYFEDVQTADWLFRGVMRVLFPSEFAKYARLPAQKRNLLGRLQKKGFWLLDAVEDPLDGAPRGGPRRARYVLEKSDLLQRLKREISDRHMSQKVPIVLIKATVYDALHAPLSRAGYNVVNKKKIPFPSSGQQLCFETLFQEVVDSL